MTIEPALLSGDDLVEFAENLARIACAGGGPSALISHLAAFLDAAVLAEDAEWRHLALAGAAGRTVPPSARDLIAAAGRVNEALVRLQPPGGGEALAAKIKAGETPLGWISVFADRPLGARAGALRLTAAAVAVELSRDAGGGKNRRRSFWERLIARAYDDPFEAKDDAASRGIALAPAYAAVAVEAEGLDEESATAKNAELRRICLDTLRTGTGEVVVLERGAGFVFLCPAPLEVDAANVRTAATMIGRAAAKAHFGAKLVGGVGRTAEAVQVYRTVEEARASLAICRRMFGGGRVMAYEDLGIYPMLLRGHAVKEELRAFADTILEPLRAYDEKHQTELIKTLRLYFAVGQNVKVAAAELSVHRHTVFYRLRQIGDISGYDLDSPHDQLTLRTAMAIDALHS
jgi:purine catabolism regulator